MFTEALLQLIEKQRDKTALPLQRKAPDREKRGKFAAFDIETDGFGGDCLICGLAIEAYQNGVLEPEYLVFSHISDMLREIIEYSPDDYKGVRFYAHNGGFDLSRAVDYFRELLEQGYLLWPVESGDNNIVGLTVYTSEAEKVFTFYDSLAVFPAGLDKFTDQFSTRYRKKKGAIDFEGGEKFDKHNAAHVEYLEYDCKGLLESVINFDRMTLEHFGVHLRMTAASTAINAFKTTLPKDFKVWRQNKTVEEFSRLAYFGGFVYLGEKSNTIHKDVITADISSSYPAAMIHDGVPYGKGVYTETYTDGDIGVYRCRVTTRGDFCCLPYRNQKGQVIWARGEFETYLTSFDIINGVENGDEIEVIEGYRFEGLFKPHETFINRCRLIRKEYKGKALETVAKLMQNSAYGKHGMKAHGVRKIYYKDDLAQGQIEGIVVDSVLGLDRYLLTEDEDRSGDYIQPHWAAFITAAARLRLHRMIRRVGFESFLYADTDSITAKSEALLRVVAEYPEYFGKEYGQFNLEKEWSAFRVIGPKIYVGLSRPYDSGLTYSPKCAIKGISKRHWTDQFILDILHDRELQVIHYESVSNLVAVLKGRKFSTIRKRRLSKIQNSACWVFEDGLFKTRLIEG